MVDKKKLNRVKGILSARKGAEIPKFNTGAKFSKQKGNVIIYSADGENWYTDPELTIRHLGGDFGFVDVSTPDTPQYYEIPGANQSQGNPQAAVENSAEVITKIEEKKENDVADVRAKLEPLQHPTQFTHQINAPKEVVEQNPNNPISAGINLKRQQDYEKQAKIDKINNVGANVGNAVFDAMGSAVGAKQTATDSNLTKGADAAYDSIASGLENAGPYGKAISTAMKTFGVAGDLIQEMGGGTDQQTTMDKWMDSSFFSWNIGMLNGFAGKNTDSFGVDQNTLAQVGSSYGGTVDDINDAASKADKKYGLFSSKARKKANEAIATAKRQQNLMGSIADSATDQRLAVQSMGEQAGLAYSLMTDGGYSQKYTYAAKEGGTLEWNPIITLEWEPQIELNWELPAFKEGGNIDIVEELEWIPELKNGDKLDFDTWFNSIPKEYRADGYDYKKAYEVFDWDLLSKHAKDPKNNHLRSVSPVADENGNFPFLKLGTLDKNKELQGEFDWYNSDEGKEHRNKFDIKFIDGRYYYVPKQLKQGGSVGDSDIPEIEETSQKNVIPEGALHKNKHHMEHADGLTKKGIPVIDDEGEQQAEIEHSEIIFTLEVTKKLEEYYKIFYSEESSNKEKEQAAIDVGKLLVFQILENTEDRTGLIESCKEGGSLTLKKTTNDLIEEVLEWMPTVVIVEEKEVLEKPKNKEEKSEKEQMKEAIKEVLIELLTK